MARWMDPATGTFLSVDPVVPAYDDPQSLNTYAYARNNPITYDDPSGMCIIMSRCVTIEYGYSPSSSRETTSTYNSSTSSWSHNTTYTSEGTTAASTDAGVAWGSHAGIAPSPSATSGGWTVQPNVGGGAGTDAAGPISSWFDLPNSALGFALGVTGLLVDALVETATFGTVDLGASVQLENGTFHFENPLVRGGAITLGARAINYQPGALNLKPHELNHVPQASLLGPFYLPANIVGMTASLVHFAARGFDSAGWITPVHGPANFMERGPLVGRPWY